jgi:hypothetical protein
MTRNPFCGLAASSEVKYRGWDTRILQESVADSTGHTNSLGRDYGGGCATRGGMERLTETKPRYAGCAQKGNPLLSSAAIVASNPGDLVRGVVQVETARRPVFSLLLACLARLLLVSCLSAVRYLRQNLANLFDVRIRPGTNLNAANHLSFRRGDFLCRDVPAQR